MEFSLWKKVLPFFCIGSMQIFAFGVSAPVFAILVFGPPNNILPQHISAEVRGLLYALLVGLNFFAKCLGGPFWGAMADCKSKRETLMWIMGGTIIGTVAIIIGFSIDLISLIILGCFMLGFFTGATSISEAVIAQMNLSMKEQEHVFSIFSIIRGFGGTAGSFIGGIFADSTFISWFSPATPFILLALFGSLLFLMIAFGLKDWKTLPPGQRKAVAHPFGGLQRNVNSALLYRFLFVNMTAGIGMYMFTRFLAPFWVHYFHATSSTLGNIFAITGVLSGLVAVPLSRLCTNGGWSYWNILGVLLLLNGVFTIFYPWLLTLWASALCVIIITALHSLVYAYFSTLLIHFSTPEEKTTLLSIARSIRALGGGIAPFIGGFVLQFDMPVIFYLAAGIGIFAWWIYHRTRWLCPRKI